MMRFPRMLPLCLILSATLPAFAGPVTDDTGRSVDIPDEPERIIVLHEPLLGIPLMDLGVEIIGAYGRGDAGELQSAVDFTTATLGDRAQTTPPHGIGPFGNINIERLRTLEPDLIIGTEYDAAQADLLSAIAPVYLQNTGTGRVRGFEVEADLAGLLRREEVFEARKAPYDTQIGKLRKGVADILPGDSFLAVIVHDQINLVGNTSGMVQALEDLGLVREDIEGSVSNAPGSNFAAPISAETFMQLNPALLVLMNSYMDPEQGEVAVHARLDRIAPGWDRFMMPAREGRILYLDPAQVTSPTVASAEHTLRAVEDWLIAQH
ncbi:ABC transporter substrate-binding protein [Ruegeria sp. Ofav3-42]|uniref:ABC transporter substrate-binding protein n=1 Tax=Ruegeria sp. Ofav3-42 TaxID=2917759 RepID=UPI001EF5D818|nr:ABC transporter substrate-binding protein [Ruegeria sp. Ofav3-42]MCG7521790.1 ABC transporter substrate-binding protein [Ruegeria sp. Ofav3-42]